MRVAALAVLLGACSGRGPTPAQPAPAASSSAPIAEDPCVTAQAERDATAALLAAGRLDRTVRVIEDAAARCPATAQLGWATEIATLAELGRWADVRGKAKHIEDAGGPADARDAARVALERATREDLPYEDSTEAKAPMRAVYWKGAEKEGANELEEALRLYLEAWKLWPSGKILAQAGHVAKALGRPAEAQRLFDRASARLRIEEGSGPTVDVPNGFIDGVLPSQATAWSAKGRIAVASGTSVVVFSQYSLQEVARLPVADVESLDFLPDERLVTGDSMGNVKVWDLSTRAWTANVDVGTHVGAVRASAASAIAIGAQVDIAPRRGGVSRADVRLLDAELRDLADIAGAPFPFETPIQFHGVMSSTGIAFPEIELVAALAFSPDGKTLAADANDGTLRLFDQATGRELRAFKGHADKVRSASFSSDGKRIATASLDQTARIWDVASGRELSRLRGAVAAGPILFLSEQTVFVPLAGWGSANAVWDVQSGAQIGEMGSAVAGAAMSPDRRHVALSRRGGDLEIWDAAKLSLVRRTGPHASSVEGVAFAGATRLATDLGGSVALWNLEDGGRTVLKSKQCPALAFAASRDGALVTTLGACGAVDFWDPSTGAAARAPALLELGSGARDVPPAESLLGTIDAPPADLVAVAPGVEHPVFAMASGGLLKLWPNVDAAPTRIPTSASRVALSANGSRVVVAPAFDRRFLGASDTLRVWEVSTGDEVAHLDNVSMHLRGLEFSPDGGAVAWVETDGVVLWSLDGPGSGERFERAHALAFAPDGRMVLVTHEGNFALLDQAGKPLNEATVAEPIEDLAVSPAGGLLAAATEDGTTLLLHLPSLSRIASVRSLEQADAGYVLSPDGYVEFRGPEREQARNAARCRFGDQLLQLEVCAERLEIADLLPRLVRDDPSYRAPWPILRGE